MEPGANCSNYTNIYVILNPENLGFARGNNVGFEFAKKTLNSDFICLINNDTLLMQDDFLSRICADYQQHHFAVLGPQILSKDQKVISLMEPIAPRAVYIVHRWLIQCQLVLCRFIPGFFDAVDAVKNCVGKLRKPKKQAPTAGESKLQPQKDIMLRGCFWIFSPDYVERFDGLDDRTFLYREEQLLFIRLKKNGLHTYYDPELKIIHLEDAATNAVAKTEFKKRVFTLQNEVKSMKILIDALKDYQGGKK